MYNQVILEAHYLDKLKRVRKKELIGVYKNLQDAEKIKDIKQETMKSDKKYGVLFKIYTNYDPFCA